MILGTAFFVLFLLDPRTSMQCKLVLGNAGLTRIMYWNFVTRLESTKKADISKFGHSTVLVKLENVVKRQLLK